MNIYVCIKQVPDTEATILVKDGKSINEAAIKWIVSPYDEYAVEEALKLKEKHAGSTVTAVCLGPERVQNALRTALAMGADRAVHVESSVALDSMNTARALAQVIRADKEYGVIFMGKQAIDDDASQLHILLAEELAIPAATNVLAFAFADGKVRVEREIGEGAREVIEMTAPCVVAAAGSPGMIRPWGFSAGEDNLSRRTLFRVSSTPVSASGIFRISIFLAFMMPIIEA